MKSSSKFAFIASIFLFFSCAESLDFNQIDDYVNKPIFKASLTYFTVVPADFFDSTGTIQQNSISETTNFDALQSKFVKDNLVKLDLDVAIKNEFDREVKIRVEFLNNNVTVYTFTPIIIQGNTLNYKYLEEIEIASNSAILNTTQVKITAELENTGIQLNLNDPSEFEFKSSVTMYIESSF
ncbi:hypothetical protein IU405_14890 [Polaribacter sp. BAL334]|uniref:hypothetical protein n=1 Tax=Polaribacter sp. BAL334 TaxID=1708178 RepID=UPI0018D249D7|nr:hypothetical protein [Polaribacter sp. BAL334]MBG7613539.1 hypothetical protein [Polaribacter sp. BAL334]